MRKTNYNISFKILIFSQLFFMAAYITIRESLALFLYHKGLPLHVCYSISTSAVSLFSVSSIVWGIFFKYLPTHKTLLKIALVFLIAGYLLMNSSILQLQILAITLYVTSASLYNITIALLVNAHFGENHDRCQGNQAYQIILNIGAVFGILGIALSPVGQYKHLYIASAILLIGAITLYFITSNKIMTIEKPEYKFWALPLILIGLIISAYLLMVHEKITRDIMLIAFMASVGYIIKLSIQESKKSYIMFLLLIIFSNVVFWLTAALFNMQFPIFLAQDVNPIFMNIHMSPLFVLVTDPLSSIIFGILIYFCFMHYDFNRFGMLTFAQGTIFVSVAILTFSLWHANSQIALYWPLLTRVIFAVGEFIIVTTLRTQVAELIKESDRQGFFMGMLKLSQAFAATSAFFLSSALTKASTDISTRLHYDFNLYAWLSIITFIGFAVLILLNFYQKRLTST